MESPFVSLALGFIKLVLLFYDFLTYPLYALFQLPCRKQAKMSRTFAKEVSREATKITYRSVHAPDKVIDMLKAEKVDTMEKVFKFCVRKHSNKDCLGTRAVLGEEQEKQPNGKVFTKLQLDDKYTWESYKQVGETAEKVGKGLRELGLKPRDKVVIYANTSKEWMMASIGAFQQSLAVVTIYTNLGEEGVQHGIAQTGAGVVVVSQDLLPRLLAVLPQCPSVHTIVFIPDPNKPLPDREKSDVKMSSMDDLILAGSQSSVTPEPPTPEDTAIIMYTSGSTGVPKGVVLTHKNLIAAMLSLTQSAHGAAGDMTSKDRYIAFLPLAHVLELLAENCMLVLGCAIGYSGTNTMTDAGTMIARGSKGDATILRPTMMCAVPLVLDRIYKGINANVKKRGAFFSGLVNLCYHYRLTWTRRGFDTPIMNRIIFGKMKMIVGGRLRVLLSGGAPLAPDAHDFIRTCLGITLLQGYGLTETGATCSVPDPSDLSTGRVGPPLQGVDIRLVNWDEGGYTVNDKQGPRGEIIIGGDHIAKEYYELPDKTQEEFFEEDGKRWFQTGDIGHIMKNGTIKIVDRKKDLVKLQGGEYVSLGKVESLIKIHSLIENICVYADPSRSNTVAIIVPDHEQLKLIAQKVGKAELSVEDMCQDPEVKSAVMEVFSKHAAGQKILKAEVPKNIYLTAELWTPESGLVTSAFKLKRKAIENTFQDQIADLYADSGSAPVPKKTVNNISQPKLIPK